MHIKLENIKKVYGSKDYECIAIDNISMNINKGEFVAICGTSGSGKTTLFNIISGIDRAYKGNCYIDGTNIKSLSDKEITMKRRNEIGVIFQFFNLISSLTVEENICLSAQLDGKKVSDKEIYNILRSVSLEDKRTSFIHELSGGQQQRVAIARVLLSNTDIILADEPTGNLDSANTSAIMGLFKRLHEQNKTIVMITHDERIANMAERIVYIKDGKVV